jgi:beta-lactamase class A
MSHPDTSQPKQALQRVLAIVTLINVLLLVVNIIWLTHQPSGQQSKNISESNQYPLLAKRIFTEDQNDILINFIPLRTSLQDYVNAQNDTLGVYFEYLPSGSSIGANSNMEVRLASLIKVPVVMAAYKEVERGHLSLDQMITLKPEYLDQTYGTLWQKGAGAQVSLRDAIRLTLTQSDNTALRVIDSQLPDGATETVFDDLNLPPPVKGGSQVVTPKDYTSILRSLYLAAFLNREHSNDMLDILTQTQFRDKLPAGLPADIKIAHKIGVWQPQDGQQVYNDCGIIYIPNRPYALCVMSQSDEDTARKHMQYVAKITYDYVNTAKR